MTDEDSGRLNRRSVLAGIGAAGVGAALGGFGTSALFTDEGHLDDNEIVAGELGLVVDWQEKYDMGDGLKLIDVFPDSEGNGTQDDLAKTDEKDKYCEAYGDIDDPLNSKKRSVIDYHSGEITKGTKTDEPLVYLDDVKPGDCWETTLSYHLCGNDGWVWFRTKNKEYPFGDSDATHLADEAWARVWYDMYDGKGAEPGDGKFEPGVEPVIAEGTLREVLNALNDGVLLDADPELGSPNGGNAENDFEFAAQADFENTHTWDGQGDENAALDCTDDEIGFWKWVLTAGGERPIEDGAALTVEYADGAEKTITGSRSGQGRGAVQFEAHKDGGGTVKDATVQYNGGGDNVVLTISESECLEGEDDQPDNGDPACTEASNTHYIGFEWCLPLDVGNDIQNDSIEFDMQFYTEQCRHNDDPQNPFVETSRTGEGFAKGEEELADSVWHSRGIYADNDAGTVEGGNAELDIRFPDDEVITQDGTSWGKSGDTNSFELTIEDGNAVWSVDGDEIMVEDAPTPVADGIGITVKSRLANASATVDNVTLNGTAPSGPTSVTAEGEGSTRHLVLSGETLQEGDVIAGDLTFEWDEEPSGEELGFRVDV